MSFWVSHGGRQFFLFFCFLVGLTKMYTFPPRREGELFPHQRAIDLVECKFDNDILSIVSKIGDCKLKHIAMLPPGIRYTPTVYDFGKVFTAFSKLCARWIMTSLILIYPTLWILFLLARWDIQFLISISWEYNLHIICMVVFLFVSK